MPAITVKNIPDELFGSLKDAAQLHRRSVNSELIHCLEAALRPRKVEPDRVIAEARVLRSRVNATRIAASDIDAAKRHGRKE